MTALADQGLSVVVGLGSVDPALVADVLDGHCRFVAAPGEAELAVAAGAIVRADARVDQALLDKAPALRVIARTGVGTDLVDDTDAVYRALDGGRLSGVGLDVFDREPPGHHPLFSHPDVVLTPHLMGLSRRATAATFTAAAQGVLDVLADREPAAAANPGSRADRPPKEISHDQLR